MQAVPPPDEPHVIYLPPPSPSATTTQWILPTPKVPVYPQPRANPRPLTAKETALEPRQTNPFRSTHSDLWAALGIITVGIVIGVVLKRHSNRHRNDFRPLPYHEFPTLPNRDDIIDVD
ncbi:MAG: hypothetical protein C0483_03375 [Pirellula sp.]|nr:hypothetical protein [Pirellula sp.]